MNQEDPDNVDKLDPQDPNRRAMQPPIPTHPPDSVAAGEADKVVAPVEPPADPNAPPLASTGIGSGPSIDQVGGAGLGEPPADGGGGREKPATTRDRDIRAEDQQDRTDKK
jgi:hypothetical protein